MAAADGALVVANGDPVRDRFGRKVDGAAMALSLVRRNAASGRVPGPWTLLGHSRRALAML